MKNWIKDIRGNVAVTAAVILPLLLAFAGGGIDFYRWGNEQSQLQELADSLALRGAREFLLANSTPAQVETVVKSTLVNGVAESFGFSSDLKIEVVANLQDLSVSVRLAKTANKALILTKFEPYKSGLDLTSTAVARGGQEVCVIALEDRGAGAIAGYVGAELNAGGCSIISNSTSPDGIVMSGQSMLSASTICSAGGVFGGNRAFTPSPILDCPVYEDPLRERQQPAVGTCDEVDLVVGTQSKDTALAAWRESVGEAQETRANGSGNGSKPQNKNSTTDANTDTSTTNNDTSMQRTQYTLDPGVYCGGIVVASDADLRLNPGIYIMKDGPLYVDRGAHLTGENVSFYFEGDTSTFFFQEDSKISLTATKDGLLAGILFFEDRNAPLNRQHVILSNDARLLLGTIYLSRGIFFVETFLPIADQSAYTVIVANKVYLDGMPTLVLNSDYSSTDIPVPDGVGPVGGTVALRN